MFIPFQRTFSDVDEISVCWVICNRGQRSGKTQWLFPWPIITRIWHWILKSSVTTNNKLYNDLIEQNYIFSLLRYLNLTFFLKESKKIWNFKLDLDSFLLSIHISQITLIKSGKNVRVMLIQLGRDSLMLNLLNNT